MKQVAVITFKDKIVYACEVRDVDSVKYLELKEEAKKNLDELLLVYEELEKIVRNQEDEIKELRHEIKVLKGEE